MRLKSWVKYLLACILFVLCLVILRNMQKSFVEDCMHEGYSYKYCVEHS